MDELQWVQRKLENNTTKNDDAIGKTPVQRMSDSMNVNKKNNRVLFCIFFFVLLLFSHGFCCFSVSLFFFLLFKTEKKTPSKQTTIHITPTHTHTHTHKKKSQYLIFWFRMLASLWMRENESDYLPFVQGTSMDQWLKQNVEALNSEADQPQCVALASCLNLPIRFLFLCLYFYFLFVFFF